MIGFKELLIILVVVLLVFGTKKLRTLGSDLGGALKGFKSAIKDDDKEDGDEGKSPGHLTADKDENGANVSARTEKTQDK